MTIPIRVFPAHLLLAIVVAKNVHRPSQMIRSERKTGKNSRLTKFVQGNWSRIVLYGYFHWTAVVAVKRDVRLAFFLIPGWEPPFGPQIAPFLVENGSLDFAIYDPLTILAGSLGQNQVATEC